MRYPKTILVMWFPSLYVDLQIVQSMWLPHANVEDIFDEKGDESDSTDEAAYEFFWCKEGMCLMCL